VSELVNEGRLRVTEDEYFGLYKKSYTPIGELAVDRLSEEEQRLLTDMTEFVCGFSAKEISEFSHNAAWEMMELGEVIPYFTALQLLPAEINDLDRQWAIDSAQAYAAEPLPV
jgi:hypothetical protein